MRVGGESMLNLEDAKYMDRLQILKTLRILKEERAEIQKERDKYIMCPPSSITSRLSVKTRKINILEMLLPTARINFNEK